MISKNICRHITGGLEQSLCLLAVQPVYKSQEENLELVVRCWLHLAHLLLTLANTHQVSFYDGPYTNNYVFFAPFSIGGTKIAASCFMYMYSVHLFKTTQPFLESYYGVLPILRD